MQKLKERVKFSKERPLYFVVSKARDVEGPCLRCISPPIALHSKLGPSI